MRITGGRLIVLLEYFYFIVLFIAIALLNQLAQQKVAAAGEKAGADLAPLVKYHQKLATDFSKLESSYNELNLAVESLRSLGRLPPEAAAKLDAVLQQSSDRTRTTSMGTDPDAQEPLSPTSPDASGRKSSMPASPKHAAGGAGRKGPRARAHSGVDSVDAPGSKGGVFATGVSAQNTAPDTNLSIAERIKLDELKSQVALLETDLAGIRKASTEGADQITQELHSMLPYTRTQAAFIHDNRTFIALLCTSLYLMLHSLDLNRAASGDGRGAQEATR